MTPGGDAVDGPIGERRVTGDRRRRPTPMLSRYWLTGRRRGARRAGEARNQYVDRYRPSEWVLFIGVLVFCVTDLLLTLEILRLGGQEWNPIMAWLISVDRSAFIVVKLGVTTLGMLFLLIHIRHRNVGLAVRGVLVLYIALMLWHVILRIAVALAESGAGGPLAAG